MFQNDPNHISSFYLLITYQSWQLIVYGQCPSYPIYNLETHLGGIDYPFIPLVSITHLEKKIDTKGWLMKRLRLALIATKNTYVIHIACDEINNDKCQ